MSIRKFKKYIDIAKPSSGFTLIEILVVLVILGILIGTSLLSFGLIDNENDLDQEARRLSALISLSSEEASTQGRDFGLELMREGYRFLEYEPFLDEWYEITGDDQLRQRLLNDKGIELILFIEDREILLHDESQNTRKNNINTEDNDEPIKRDLTDDYLPHILIMSSGDISPFNLIFTRPALNSSRTLTIDLGGTMTIKANET